MIFSRVQFEFLCRPTSERTFKKTLKSVSISIRRSITYNKIDSNGCCFHRKWQVGSKKPVAKPTSKWTKRIKLFIVTVKSVACDSWREAGRCSLSLQREREDRKSKRRGGATSAGLGGGGNGEKWRWRGASIISLGGESSTEFGTWLR